MHTEFTSIPKLFRDKEFASCDVIDYMNLLLELDFKVPHRGMGTAYIFEMVRFHDAWCTLALFVLRERDTLLLKQAITEVQPDAISFGAPASLTFREFNRIPLPIIEHIPLMLLHQRRTAREQMSGKGKPVH